MASIRKELRRDAAPEAVWGAKLVAADARWRTRIDRTLGPHAKERCCVFETAIGVCGVAWSERGITSVQLPERSRSATERRLRGRSASGCTGAPPAPVRAAIALLARYFGGENVDLSRVALDLSGVAAFHRRVYDRARALAWGETVTYGELARQAGSPGAARAVGRAMGSNPVPIIIPCHRVLAAGGKIGGFSAHGGAITKARLLALEGVHLGHGTALLPGLDEG